ncbi:MAG: hypothetical protein QOI47_183 [Actinomycetota bacterium]|nr:hypothetical protein [Actinomycetota bacterium]
MDGIRASVLDAGRAITPLLADPRVVARWSEPSALAELSIGGLAGHLVRALETIELYLDEPEPSDDRLIGPSSYFVAALKGAGRDIQSDAHRGVRQRGEEAGAMGPEALLAAHVGLLDRLAERFEREPATRRVTVMRGAARMKLDDYLPTRIVEMTVHADDLAASTGADPPAFGTDVTSCAIEVLVGTAREDRGDLAVLRALARRERDADEALRVL